MVNFAHRVCDVKSSTEEQNELEREMSGESEVAIGLRERRSGSCPTFVSTSGTHSKCPGGRP